MKGSSAIAQLPFFVGVARICNFARPLKSTRGSVVNRVVGLSLADCLDFLFVGLRDP
jgi:hypothetical protein